MAEQKPLTNKQLTERLHALEAKQLKVRDLPIQSLRRELAKEPQDPGATLLPHSVGPESLQSGLSFTFHGAHTYTGGAGLATTNSKLSAGPECVVPSDGTYLVSHACDIECTAVGFGIAETNLGGQTIFKPTAAGGRMRAAGMTIASIASGTTIFVLASASAGGLIYNAELSVMEIL